MSSLKATSLKKSKLVITILGFIENRYLKTNVRVFIKSLPPGDQGNALCHYVMAVEMAERESQL